MPVSLALCVDAPMQSWGTRSRGTIRDTTTEPTKSGMVGLLAAARGIPREDTASVRELIKEMAELRMAVRVDREGIMERDFQTARNVPTTKGTGHRTVVSERYYLADALFLVVLEGDRDLLTKLYKAVQYPVWPLFFGRRAFVPAQPLVMGPEPGPEQPLTGQGIVEASADEVLKQHLWLEPAGRTRRAEFAKEDSERLRLRTVVDCDPSDPLAELRHDYPVSFAWDARRFASRTTRLGEVRLTTAMIATGEPTCT